MNGTVPGVVHASFIDAYDNNVATLGHLQQSQTIIAVDCTLLNYSVFTMDNLAIFILF